jgi:cell division septation protein DedD
MATTTHDDGFHEIQLNGKQLVFLFMAGTVVAVVIFLLGVFVGRGVRVGASEVNPVVAEQQTDPVGEGPEIPPAIVSSGAAPAATPDVTYPIVLGGNDPPKETLQPSASNAASAPSKSSAPSATNAPAPSAPGPPNASAKAVRSEPSGDGFSIQLAALAKRDEAEGIVRRLTEKGYSAYLMSPSAGAPPVYRVRVGKFKERREAESVSSRLQKEEQFKPWIVR